MTVHKQSGAASDLQYSNGAWSAARASILAGCVDLHHAVAADVDPRGVPVLLDARLLARRGHEVVRGGDGDVADAWRAHLRAADVGLAAAVLPRLTVADALRRPSPALAAAAPLPALAQEFKAVLQDKGKGAADDARSRTKGRRAPTSQI